jgi:hypothetical protein
LSSVEVYNETQPSAYVPARSQDDFGIKRSVCRKLRRRLEDIRDLRDTLEAFMLSVNEVLSQHIGLYFKLKCE